MSALVHCDGPGCDQTTDDVMPPRLCTPPWIRIKEGEQTRALDFHSKECLANWARGLGPDRCGEGFRMIGDGGVRKVAVCNQVKGHDGPHALATARTIHAEVDGR